MRRMDVTIVTRAEVRAMMELVRLAISLGIDSGWYGGKWYLATGLIFGC